MGARGSNMGQGWQRWIFPLLCCLLCGVADAADVPPHPAVTIPLAELGYPGHARALQRSGASVASVHFVDDKHALVTYSMRSLVPRLPNAEAGEMDRLVAAVLVDVPSGKVMARAEWRLHDYGSFLWKVAPGVFVVRIGEDLSVIAPLESIAAGGKAFQRWALPHAHGQPVLITGSADGKILTVETEQELPPAMGDAQDPGARKHYVLDFYRLVTEHRADLPVHVERAGAVGSAVRIRLAMDGDGYLWTENNQRGQWQVTFNEFGGAQQHLAPVMSSCNPRLSLLSRSEFLVQTCKGSDQQPMIVSYGFDGHENWEEALSENLQPPVLALAPVAGRFALSRLMPSSTGAPTEAHPEGDPLAQEVRVYQTESGDMLLHVACSPVVRSAENFDLSPDGMTLAVLGKDAVELFALPKMTAKDRKDLEEAATMTPPEGFGPVQLQRIARPVERAAMDVGAGEPPAAAPPSPRASVPAESKTSAGPALKTRPVATDTALAAARSEGDAGTPEQGEHRKRPTLLNPGEKPEFRDKTAGGDGPKQGLPE